MTSPSLPKDHLVIKNQTHYQEAYGLEYKKDGKTNAWFAPDYVDPLTYLHVLPRTSKARKWKWKFTLSAPSKSEIDALQRAFPDATVTISPQEILNELCSVSFGLQAHVNRLDILTALQKLVDEHSIIPPVGISVANKRASKSKFGSIFFLGPMALFTFVNKVPSFFLGSHKVNIEPRWNELKLMPNLVQLYGWKMKSKIEVREAIEALGIESGRYLMKVVKGLHVDFVIAMIQKEKLPMFIHDVETNLPGVTVNLVTMESNLMEKRGAEQAQQQGVDTNHQFSKLTIAQIETKS